MDPPTGIEPAQHGWDLYYFRRMRAAGAVDCLQAEVSRCGGITEWLRVAAVAASYGLQVSGHCVPTCTTTCGSSRSCSTAPLTRRAGPSGPIQLLPALAWSSRLSMRSATASASRPMLAVEIRPVREG